MGVQRAVLAALLVVVVAGCSDYGSGTRADPTSSTRPPDPVYAGTTPTLTLDATSTPASSTLRFGDQAVVPYYGLYDTGLLGITVTVDSRPVTDEDLDSLNLVAANRASVRGKTFHFARLHLVNVDGSNLSYADIPPLSGAWSRNVAGLGSFVSIGAGATTVADCAGLTSTAEFATEDAAVDACQPFVGEANDPIASISYAGQPYSAATAIMWQAGK